MHKKIYVFWQFLPLSIYILFAILALSNERKKEKNSMEKFLKASTKVGSRWILAAKNNEGYELSDIYDSYSVNNVLIELKKL